MKRFDTANNVTTAHPTLLTVDQAAEVLQVNRKTIHLLLAQGLPHQRVGRRIIRIQTKDLLAWGRVIA